MSDRPYTDDDLRAEAARQHHTASCDHDFMGIGEQMDGRFIDSTVVDPDPQTGTEPVTGTTWDKLPRKDFDAAQRAIDDLLTSAADLSEWAINLGVDGLEPESNVIAFPSAELGADFARMYFAFHPDVPADTRTHVISRIRNILAANL